MSIVSLELHRHVWCAVALVVALVGCSEKRRTLREKAIRFEGDVVTFTVADVQLEPYVGARGTNYRPRANRMLLVASDIMKGTHRITEVRRNRRMKASQPTDPDREYRDTFMLTPSCGTPIRLVDTSGRFSDYFNDPTHFGAWDVTQGKFIWGPIALRPIDVKPRFAFSTSRQYCMAATPDGIRIIDLGSGRDVGSKQAIATVTACLDLSGPAGIEWDSHAMLTDDLRYFLVFSRSLAEGLPIGDLLTGSVRTHKPELRNGSVRIAFSDDGKLRLVYVEKDRGDSSLVVVVGVDDDFRRETRVSTSNPGQILLDASRRRLLIRPWPTAGHVMSSTTATNPWTTDVVVWDFEHDSRASFSLTLPTLDD